jgi:hypothetical protein
MMVALALSSLVVGGTAAAKVGWGSGNALFDACQRGDNVQDPERWANDGMCGGYIGGVADALNGTSFCLSVGIVERQVEDVVKLYLRDHPEKRHFLASDPVTAALKEKFPCN